MNGQSPAMQSREQRAARYSILDRPGWEVLNWAYYDFQTYVAGGQTQLTFFQSPKGASGRTLRDTNFPGAGSLPAGYEFFMETFQIMPLPGVQPSTFGAQVTSTFVRDVWTIHNDGFVVFNLLNKHIIEGGPIGLFPCDWRMMGFAAVADESTIVANAQTIVAYAQNGGKIWRMNNQLLEATVNFDITLNWNTALALPSAVAARIGCFVTGKLRRKMQ